MKNLINIFLFSILQSLSLKSVHQDLSNFNKGNNFNECLSNCRYYHRNVLNLNPGEGRGFCWNECNQEHQ